MAINKVVYGGNTLIDLTDLDVTAGDVLDGVSFIMADGTKAVGAFSPSVNTTTTTLSGSAPLILFTGLTKEPTAFAVIANTQISLSKTRTVLSIVANGTSVYAVTGYKSSSTATVYITGSYVTWSYTNGRLTINTTSSSTGGNFADGIEYVLVYS